MTKSLPSLFLSHGAPTLPLEEGATPAFLRALGQNLPRPEAILIVSAHWEAAEPSIGMAERPETIHDFYGFPDALYRLRYPAHGSRELGERATALLAEGGLTPQAVADQGLDHGAWVPLLLMYPEADIPVVQLSLTRGQGAAHHHEIGRLLAPLREEGVLLVGSGGAVHNLGALSHSDRPAPWAQAFEDWLVDSVTGDRRDELLAWQDRGDARQAQPTDEHFLPLFFAMGAGQGAGRLLHRGFTYGSLSMAAFAWDH